MAIMERVLRGRTAKLGPTSPETNRYSNKYHLVASPTSSLRGDVRNIVYRFGLWLDEPVHSSTIAIFRIAYALCVLAQCLKWDNMFLKFAEVGTVFPYPGLGWIKPASPAFGATLLTICKIASFCQLVGFATHIATFVGYLSFAWLFHICESNFNNHYIFMCHILFLGTFLHWGHWLSVDHVISRVMGRPMSSYVPRWNLFLARTTMIIPYFWGGVAKMNSDWLFHAQPVAMWFQDREGLLGLYKQPWFPWFICWTGCIFDLVIGFLLVNRRTRYILAFPAALTFNTCNKIMFNIGVFPLMMMSSLVLFVDPHQPAQLCSWIIGRKFHGLASPTAKEGDVEKGSADGAVEQNRPFLWGLTAKQTFPVVLVTLFYLFHGLNPLRHFVLFPGNPSWHEEGHQGAWHMKLRTKNGWVMLKLEDSHGDSHIISPKHDPYLYRSQASMMSKPHPLMIYVGRLKQVFEEGGNPLKSVTPIDCWGLNNRDPHHLYKRDANLLNFVGKYEWWTVSGSRPAPDDPSKWLWKDEEGPVCNIYELQERKRQIQEETPQYLKAKYAAAGIRRASYAEAVRLIPGHKRVFRGANKERRVLIRADKTTGRAQYAYTWDNGL